MLQGQSRSRERGVNEGELPFPANAILLPVGQKCALFRAAPIIAVEERRRGFTHRGSCNFSEPFTPV